MGFRSEGTDTLLSFFDFHPMSTRNDIPFPDDAFLLDLTDIVHEPRGSADAAVFLRIDNTRWGNGASGEILSFELEEPRTGLRIPAKNAPFPVSDGSPEAELIVSLKSSTR
jgi:hypothetical protein